MTPAQEATLRDVAAGRVTRNDSWHVIGARADVLARLEERAEPLVEWAGPEPGHRRGPRAPGPMRLTDAGRARLDLLDERVARGFA
jgi:hypothetical protein